MMESSWRRCGALSVCLAVLLLLVSVAPSIRPYLFESVQSNALRSIVAGRALVVPLLLDVVWFVLAALALHLVIAAASLLLTKASETAGLTASRNRMGVCFLWFTALAATVMLLCAAGFPNSHAGGYYGVVANQRLLGWSVAQAATALVCVAATALLGAALVQSFRQALTRNHALRIGAVCCVGVAGLLVFAARPHARPSGSLAQPHVIIIGIDSLRADLARQLSNTGELPNVARVLARSAWFTDTTTPLARTFPSWLSILTGRAPGKCGVVCNLMPRDQVEPHPTLADHLAQQGYTGVFATDEVRFSNIDESYGFKQVVTPAIGASDFLIAQFSDIPLVNLVANWPMAAWLFPQVHTNRAVAYVYEPDSFVRRLRRDIRFDAPTLLAIHLTVPHWPYVSAQSSRRRGEGSPWDLQYLDYRDSLKIADGQLGQVMDWLEGEGILQNALVVLLSDHGEALLRPGDSLLDEKVDPGLSELRVARTGHGSSILSPAQFQVVLGFAGYGAAATRVTPGVRAEPASLEDVTPTLLNVLGVTVSGFDGVSLAASLHSVTPRAETGERVRFTETGFNTPQMLAGDFDPRIAALQGAGLYRVNPDTGYLELRAESTMRVAEFKERAAIKGPWLLAALPVGNGRHAYVLARRDGTEVRRVDSLGDDAVARDLWDALSARFGPDAGTSVQLNTGAQRDTLVLGMAQSGRDLQDGK